MQERLRRAGRAYADGNLEEAEYERRKREAEAEFASLVLPAEQEVQDAREYLELEQVGQVWNCCRRTHAAEPGAGPV